MKFKILQLFQIVVCVFLPQLCVGIQIFGFFPFASRSQYLVGKSLMIELVERGHNVTMMSPYFSNEQHNNFNEILFTLPSTYYDDDKLQAQRKSYMLSELVAMSDRAAESTRITLLSPELRNLIREQRHFQLVIVDYMVNDASLTLGEYFSAPIIVLSGFPHHAAEIVGVPPLPFSIPLHNGTLITSQTIGDTVQNLFWIGIEKMYKIYYGFGHQKALYEEWWPKPRREIQELKSTVALVLLNTHFSLNYPRLSVPNVVEVGGIHIKKQAKSMISCELEELIENAHSGLIYVSLGSAIHNYPDSPKLIQAIIDAFSVLEQTVLWRWNELDVPAASKNIIFRDWFPQIDLLAHDKMRLFITALGPLSLSEAIYHAVPVIAIPTNFIGYQNQDVVTRSGIGLIMEFEEITMYRLFDAINEVLTVSFYAYNAKEKSTLYRDRMGTPMETAMYWIEYVIKYKGAPQLRVSKKQLALIQYYNMEAMFVIFLAALFTSALCVGCLMVFCKFCMLYERCPFFNVFRNFNRNTYF